MKKLILLIITLTFLNAKSQTSIYHPFPDSAAIWNFHYALPLCGGGSLNSYYSIIFSNDTIINSQNYHKLEIPYVQNIVIGNCPAQLLNGYKGAIRQDTSMRKVFYIPPSDSSEQLLYDFNLQVGDTVQGYLESNSFSKDIVLSIDSILVGSNYRKRWLINQGYNIYIIEGIGSTYGLIQSSPGNIVDYPDNSLMCFLQNGSTLYPDTTTNCQLINEVVNIFSDDFFTTISPNPFSDKLIVTINNNELFEIILYDITSRKILRQNFTNSVSLNTEHLVKGIYILELRDKNGSRKKEIALKQ